MKKIDLLPIRKVDCDSAQIGGNHYQNGLSLQWRDLCETFAVPFIISEVGKYVYRHKNKGQLQDLKKAIHLLQDFKDGAYAKFLKMYRHDLETFRLHYFPAANDAWPVLQEFINAHCDSAGCAAEHCRLDLKQTYIIERLFKLDIVEAFRVVKQYARDTYHASEVELLAAPNDSVPRDIADTPYAVHHQYLKPSVSRDIADTQPDATLPVQPDTVITRSPVFVNVKLHGERVPAKRRGTESRNFHDTIIKFHDPSYRAIRGEMEPGVMMYGSYKEEDPLGPILALELYVTKDLEYLLIETIYVKEKAEPGQDLEDCVYVFSHYLSVELYPSYRQFLLRFNSSNKLANDFLKRAEIIDHDDDLIAL